MIRIFKPASLFFQYLREFGFWETFFRSLHRLRIISAVHSFIFTLKEIRVRDGVLILNSLDEAEGSKVCQINGFQVILREIKEEELENLSFAKEMYSIETFCEHFARGMRFFAAFHEGVVVSVNAVNTKYAHLSYIKLPIVQLPHGATYINCALTSPDYRNLGLGTLLRTFLLNKMWKEGYKLMVGAVLTDNQGALRWNATNGFQQWGKIFYIQFCGRDFWVRRLTSVGRRFPYIFDHVEPLEQTNLILEKVS